MHEKVYQSSSNFSLPCWPTVSSCHSCYQRFDLAFCVGQTMAINCCVLDNTASVLTKRGGFRRREQSLYRLPVLIVDSGTPALSSTNTLSVQVCDCDADGVPQACGAVAYSLPAGLSTGALLAILGCILTLLGKTKTEDHTFKHLKLLFLCVSFPKITHTAHSPMIHVFAQYKFSKLNS